jgi:MFS superfamily sulfate permease-like transporter
VSIGLLLSFYFIIQNNFRAEYKITRTVIHGVETELIKLNSNVTFLNKVKLKKALDEVPGHSVLTIDGSNCNFIDYDILEIISEFENKAKDRSITLYTMGIEKVNVTAIH